MDEKLMSVKDKIIHNVHLNAQDILLYLRNSLSHSTKELIDKHITICKDCHARLNIARQIASHYRNPGAEEQAAFDSHRNRYSGAAKHRFEKIHSLLKFKPAWALASAVLLIFIVSNFFMSLPSVFLPVFNGKEFTRIKGALPYINIYRKHSEEIEVLKDFSTVEEKDNVQLSYISGAMKYGIIFSFDGNGYLTMHYPASLDPESSIALDNKGEIFLSHSFIFDNAPAFERFFFVASEKEFAVERIVATAKKLTTSKDKGQTGMLELPPEYKQFSIILSKKRN